MTTVDAHNFEFPDAEGEMDFVASQLSDSPRMISKRPKNTGPFFNDSLRLIGFRAFLERPENELLEALEYARDLGVALFRRGRATPDETVTFTFAGETVEVPGGTSHYNTAPRWLSTFGVALALRDEEALDDLCKYNPIDFEGSYDHYRISLAAALMAMHTGSDETEATFDAALEQTAKADTFPEFARDVGEPLVRLARAVHDENDNDFDDILVTALEGYRKQYNRQNQRHLAEGYLPMPHVGLCSLAYDRGIETGVSSPYLPKWLICGETDTTTPGGDSPARD